MLNVTSRLRIKDRECSAVFSFKRLFVRFFVSANCDCANTAFVYAMDHESRSKRKRSPQGHSSPPANRPRRNPVDTTPPYLRAFQSLFNVFTLLQTVHPENGPFDEAWYFTVQQHARSDAPQEKRMAVRVLRRIAPKYPQFISTTVTTLIDVSAWRPASRSYVEQKSCEDARNDAFVFLGDVFEWTTLELRPQILQIIPHLFRLATSHRSSRCDVCNCRQLYEVHKLADPTRISLGIPLDGSYDNPEGWTILVALSRGLKHYTRDILSECIRIWTDMPRPYHDSANVFFNYILLPPATPDTYSLAHGIFSSDKDLHRWTLHMLNSVIESAFNSDVT